MIAQGAGNIPPAGQSDLTDKLLRQSRPPDKSLLEKKKKPEIVIKDSRKLKDPGSGPSFLVKAIEIEGNTIFDDETLGKIVDVGDGMELTLGILSLMAQEVKAHYASNGYILAKTYVPKQKVRDGKVKIVVREGEIGKIQVTGNKKLKSKDFVRRLRKVKQEGALKEQTLEEVLTELNDMLGVKVRTVLKPGELPGTSDLILEVTETPPYTASLDGDNFGSRFTGANRLGLSASAGNFFTLGDQFSFRGVRSDLEQSSVTGSYLYPFIIPFTDEDAKLKISPTYSEQTLGDTLSSLAAGGNSNTFSLELSTNFLRSRIAQLTSKIGFDARHSKNYQLSAVSSHDNILGVYLNVGGNTSDKYMGRSFFDFTLRRGINESDKNRALISRADGRGNILVASTSFMRFQGTKFLGSYFIMKLSGQMTSSRALSGDLFAAGGLGTVRGFPISEHSGDNGYLASVEYVLPFPYKIPIGIEKLTLAQILSLTGFIEYGEVFVRARQSGESNESITGGGVGIQLNLPKIKWIPASSFSTSYAVPLQGPNPSDGSYGTWYVNGLLSYTFN